MSKEQAEKILTEVVANMRLTKKEYDTLMQAIAVLKSANE